MRVRVVIGLLFSVLFSSFAFGQDADPSKQPPPASEQAGAPKPRQIRWPILDQPPEERLLDIKDDVGLDETQTEQVRAILIKEQDQLAQLRESMQIPEATRKQINSIGQEMMQARQTNDQARIEQLMALQRDITHELRMQRKPYRDQIDAIHLETHKGISAVLRPDQTDKFEKYWDVYISTRRPRMSFERSPRALKAAVDRLKDLTSDQKSRIEILYADHKKSIRDAAQTPVGTLVVDKKLYDDVFAILTPSQQQTVEQQLAGRQGAQAANAGNRPVAPTTPPPAPPGQGEGGKG